MRTEPDFCAIALALAQKYPLEEVAAKVGCAASNVSYLARGLTRHPILKHRHAWVKAWRDEFNTEPPQREGRPYLGGMRNQA